MSEEIDVEVEVEEELSIGDELRQIMQPDQEAGETAPDEDVPGAEDSVEEQLNAPEHWTTEHKELFGGLDPTGQQALLDINGSMQADYTKKTTEIADTRKFAEEINGMFGPYAEQLRSAGLNPQQAIQRLLDGQTAYTNDPVAYARQVAAQAGLSLVDDADEFVDPNVSKLEQGYRNLDARINQLDATQEQSQNHAVNTTIDEFSSRTDGEGNLMHPHFDAVRAVMVPFVQQGSTLEAAYEQATWANPETRKAMQENLISADKKANTKVVAQAKRTRNVKSSGSNEPDQKMTIAEEMKQLAGEAGLL